MPLTPYDELGTQHRDRENNTVLTDHFTRLNSDT